jgi:hypothetical protein
VWKGRYYIPLGHLLQVSKAGMCKGIKKWVDGDHLRNLEVHT